MARTDIPKLKSRVLDTLIDQAQIECGEGVSNIDEVHERSDRLDRLATAHQRIDSICTRSIKRIRYHLNNVLNDELIDVLILDAKS